MKRRTCFGWALPLFCAAAMCAAQLSAPRIGTVRYADGSVWTVNGLKANVLLGKQLFTGITAASFSDAGGLIAKPGEIDLVDRDGVVISRYATDEAHPVLRMDGDLVTASIWLPSKRIALRWNGKSFTETEAEAPDTASVHYKSFTLFSDAAGFEVQSADGGLRTLPISAKDIQVEQMASDWLHLSSAAAHRDWALFLTDKELHLSELPTAPQETSK